MLYPQQVHYHHDTLVTLVTNNLDTLVPSGILTSLKLLAIE